MAASFIWYELMTGDAAAAVAFYREVVGWTSSSFDGTDDYTILNVGSRGVAGVMPMSAEYRAAGGRPVWLGYVHVPDVDAAAERLTSAGGTLHRGPWDVPGAGRIAAVADPQGAMFMLMTPDGPDTPPLAAQTPGAIGWHELYAADGGAAFTFYAEQFDWSDAGSHDMGPIGIYRLFATGDAPAAGGMMMRMNPATRPHWQYYFNVDGLDAAAARMSGAGGSILTAPHEVPGGGWIAQCADPEGAQFALLSAGR